MNEDSFKQIELLFHELSGLDASARQSRLDALDKSDPFKGRSLRIMFDSMTKNPNFLDESTIDSLAPASVDIPLDGSVVLGNRYRLVERIGVGGSSTVFRANASEPRRDVAVKMLRIGLDSHHIRERFMIESESLASLTHPHIAHVYQTGFYESNGVQVPWIAMELVSGSQTIIDYANSHALDANARINLFVEVCEAVRAAHQTGILHLDLNASNILVDAHGYPKIIDFGLCGILNSLNRKTLIHVGTRISMAPEQTVFRSGAFDERTDIYALGLLLTELLTGTQLQRFQGVSTDHALRLIAIGKARELLKELADIPDEIASVIDGSIFVDPDKRYQSIDSFLLAIQQGVGAELSPPTTRLKRSIQLAGALAALVIAALLIHQTQRTKEVVDTQAEMVEQEMIAIPRQLAIDLTAQNPRRSLYSHTQSRLLQGIELAVESDPTQTAEEQAGIYAMLADQHRVAGRYDEAVQYYQRSAQLLKEHNRPIDYNWVMLSLIQTHIFLESIDQAQHELELLNREVELSILFRVDLSLAESAIHLAMNRPESALRQAKYTEGLINELRVEDERVRIERLLDLASVYEASADFRSASSTLRDAKTIVQQMENPSSPEVALIDIKIGMNDAPDALDESLDDLIEEMSESVVKLMESGDEFHAAWGLRQIGNVHLRTGNFDLAQVCFAKSYAQMVRLLGDDHHEAILCQAYELIAQHAKSDDSMFLNEQFTNTITKLSQTLGKNHSMIHSLQNDWDNLYLWDTNTSQP